VPQILPLAGIRYTAKAGTLSDLLAPPYDVISPAQQRALGGRNAHNAVHLELAEGGVERYARVAALLESWLAEGALARDGAPMLYLYEQQFEERGKIFNRRALIAGVEAQPWDEGAVKPHEFTMSGPKEDRLRLLQATRTQFSPIFMIARDRAGQLRDFLATQMAARPADHEAFTADGDTHRLWVIEVSRFEMRHIAPLLAESFYIADGHHRYETAVNYRNSLLDAGQQLERDHPARFALTAIVAADDPGLVIRPIHRIVPKAPPANWAARLDPYFTTENIGRTDARAAEDFLSRNTGILAVGLEPGIMTALVPREGAAWAAATPKGQSKELARIWPNRLRYGALEPLWDISDDDLRAGLVEYTHESQEVIGRAATPGATGFLLSPVSIEEVMLIADKGERMPQKSTFFHPKMGTGLVFHPLYP
jgi:uncharacterized protein (DUF1015 family)